MHFADIYTQYTPNIHPICTQYTLNMHPIYTQYAPNIHPIPLPPHLPHLCYGFHITNTQYALVQFTHNVFHCLVHCVLSAAPCRTATNTLLSYDDLCAFPVVVTICIDTTYCSLRECRMLQWLHNGCHAITMRHVCAIYQQHVILKEEHSPVKLLLKTVRYNPQDTKISGPQYIILL